MSRLLKFLLFVLVLITPALAYGSGYVDTSEGRRPFQAGEWILESETVATGRNGLGAWTQALHMQYFATSKVAFDVAVLTTGVEHSQRLWERVTVSGGVKYYKSGNLTLGLGITMLPDQYVSGTVTARYVSLK